MLKLTGDNWESEIEKRTFAVLVNFYNPGCSHCVNFKTSYENLAQSFKDILTVSYTNNEAEDSYEFDLTVLMMPRDYF